MQHTVTLISASKKVTCTVQHGTNALSLLVREGFSPDAPCGGNGTCGKCRVVMRPAPPLTREEATLLTPAQAEQGVRLACQCRIEEDCSITMESVAGSTIAVHGITRSLPFDPPMQKRCIIPPQASLEDQRSLEQRVLEAAGLSQPLPLSLLRQLAGRESESQAVTLTCYENTPLRLEWGDCSTVNYGVAVDIGTTTVCAYLFNLVQGNCIGTASGLNAQRSFGADVISRIEYTKSRPDGLSALQQCIAGQINELVAGLCLEHSVPLDGINLITLVGNTTMLHLLCGVNPSTIAVSPFSPAFTQAHSFPAESLGLSCNPHCIAKVLGGVSAYVGADTVAAMVACSMDLPQKALLVDIGTNGEIVLNTGGRLIACSTAAGPAFEGAHIRCGTGGTQGAISAVRWEGGRFCYETIGGSRPIGICGSGIVSTLAMLIELGVVDETGRMVDADELEDEAVGSHIVEISGQNAFVLADDIVFTAKDVREVQLAKAAIAAGISTLLDEAGLAAKDLETIYLAGGFGSYLDRDSAQRIGLLPPVDKERIVVSGNAAGSGAAAVLCSRQADEYAVSLQSRCEYIELSTSAKFQQYYMDCMIF